MLWRLGYEELGLRVSGPFPSPRVERLRGTVVTLATTAQGAVLGALAGGVVSPGLGSLYLERAAEAFFPRLPSGRVTPGRRWTDTLAMTEVLRGVTARIQTIVTYTIADTSAIAGRPVVPVTYVGRTVVTGAGTIEGSRVSLSGAGTLDGHYLYDPGERIFDLHVQEHVLDSTLTIAGPQRTTLTIPSRQVLRARAERLF
jgi:hypothetical protein